MKVRLIFQRHCTGRYSEDSFVMESQCKTVVTEIPEITNDDKSIWIGDWQIIGYEEIKSLAEEELDEWQTGEPIVDDPFLVKEFYVLEFYHPSGYWYLHGHLFKPCGSFFRSCVDKSIIFPYNDKDMRWHVITPSEE